MRRGEFALVLVSVLRDHAAAAACRPFREAFWDSGILGFGGGCEAARISRSGKVPTRRA